MLPPPQANGAASPAGSHSCLGERELSKTITAPATCGMTPTNPADLYCWVVPVLLAIGRFQPTLFAAAAAVPAVSSLASPVSRVLASAGSSTFEHASSFTRTGFPVESKTPSMGVGGHQVPPLARVAIT